MDAPDGLTVQNIVVTVGAAVGTAIGAGVAYFKTRKSEPAGKPHDMIISSGTIADMKPVRDAAFSLERIAEAVEAIHTMMAENSAFERGVEAGRRMDKR